MQHPEYTKLHNTFNIGNVEKLTCFIECFVQNRHYFCFVIFVHLFAYVVRRKVTLLNTTDTYTFRGTSLRKCFSPQVTSFLTLKKYNTKHNVTNR